MPDALIPRTHGRARARVPGLVQIVTTMFLIGCGGEASRPAAPAAEEIVVPAASSAPTANASASAHPDRTLVEGLSGRLSLDAMRTKRAECKLLIDAATVNVEEVTAIYAGPGDAAELRAIADAMRRFDGVLKEMKLTVPEVVDLAEQLRASAKLVERSARIMASTQVEKTFNEASASFDQGTRGMGKLGEATNKFCHDL